MTISSSLNAGVAGLASNANRLATISDNIANSQTAGYKRVETDFQSMVMGTTGGGAYAAGGVRTSSHRLVDQGGSLVATNNATDLAVSGSGFLPVAQASDVLAGNGDPQMFLGTTGSFRTDASGFLKTESGLILMGWPAAQDGSIPVFPRDTSAGLEPVQINKTQLIGEPTTTVSMGVNLPATETNAGASGDPLSLAIEYFDSLGTSETLNVSFTPTVPAVGSSNTWTMEISDSASAGAVIDSYELIFDTSLANGGSLASVNDIGTGTYNAATGSFVVNVAGGPIEINIGAPLTNDGMTQLSNSFAPLNVEKDGAPVGTMTSVEVDPNGFVLAFFDTGITKTVYQVPLVDVPNPNGMMAMDNQVYMPSRDSGSFFLWDAGDGPVGEVAAFAREESATDVARELTDMIQTQRAYSSNAKVIQTVDEMLQETTNIKR